MKPFTPSYDLLPRFARAVKEFDFSRRLSPGSAVMVTEIKVCGLPEFWNHNTNYDGFPIGQDVKGQPHQSAEFSCRVSFTMLGQSGNTACSAVLQGLFLFNEIDYGTAGIAIDSATIKNSATLTLEAKPH